MCIKYVIVKNTLYLVAETMFYILKKINDCSNAEGIRNQVY